MNAEDRSARSSLRPTRPPLTGHPSNDDQILTLCVRQTAARLHSSRVSSNRNLRSVLTPRFHQTLAAPQRRHRLRGLGLRHAPLAAAPMRLGLVPQSKETSKQIPPPPRLQPSRLARRGHIFVTLQVGDSYCDHRAVQQRALQKTRPNADHAPLASTHHCTARLSQLCCDLRAQGTDPYHTTMSISGRCRRLQDVLAIVVARRSATMTSDACQRDADKDWIRTVRRPSTLHPGLVLILVLDLDSESLLGSTVVGGAESIALWEMGTTRVVRGFSSSHCLRDTPPRPTPVHTGPQRERTMCGRRSLATDPNFFVFAKPRGSLSGSCIVPYVELAAARERPASLLPSPLLDDARMGALRLAGFVRSCPEAPPATRLPLPPVDKVGRAGRVSCAAEACGSPYTLSCTAAVARRARRAASEKDLPGGVRGAAGRQASRSGEAMWKG
ncbi:hypothetical protein DFH08DRAFT_827063 [Mycena albidolilacea]|uniref:Uncharacterized protein n=1 Tax=Mycena albidolilacea TaxID=1033008 RepID=A0AAD6YZ82_9AGAR|nr:hypothetical protein DFH08DRAFT_827063 [Mycena albidolilacea]